MRVIAIVTIALIILIKCTTSSSASEASPTVVEGTIVQASHLPEPKTNPYPDCYFTVVVEASRIIAGKSIPQKFTLVLPGFFSREYSSEAGYKKGDMIRVSVVPFSSMPDNVKQIQQADEIEDLDLELFFPVQIQTVHEFSTPKEKIGFTLKKQERPPQKPSSKIVRTKSDSLRKAQMEHDLAEIEKLLQKNGGDWDKWYQSLKPVREKYAAQQQVKAQKWIGDSFFSAGKVDNGETFNAKFVESIKLFKEYLAARNVDLILIRMPHKGEIVDDLFTGVPQDQTYNPYLLRMYKTLLEADIEIIPDVISAAKAQRFKFPLMYWYQDFSEIHPAEGIAWVIAEEMARRISRYDIVPSLPSTSLSLKRQPHETFKWPAGNPKFNELQPAVYSAVFKDSRPLTIGPGQDSPVLIIGSSIISTPSLYPGGSIPHYFAYLSHIVPDMLFRAGGDSMVLRNVAREGDGFLNKRAVCLFPFVPGTPYASFAPLPLFDPDHSVKDFITSYTGSLIPSFVHYTPTSSAGKSSFSSDGVLEMWPEKGKRGAEGQLTIEVPEKVSEFPYFIVEIEFKSKEITYLTARYSKAVDSIVRSDTQPNNVESFTFATDGQSRKIEIDLSTGWIIPQKGVVPPTAIKSISFFGVKRPNYYREQH
ncbi:hypothetical protein [Geomonas subterranea]|uniref:hypothetical protein n=1 Tax=Geomonas subterranea TaxID=2847989 RepID=UPI001CD331A6|nr:hypothetical protein [Geomonas fuzhouensis]